MADTSTLLEDLQADVLAVLKNTPSLADAVILADNEGDIEARVIKNLGSLSGGPTGKRGLVVIVLLPEVDSAEQNLPGPVMKLQVEIQTLENVLINRNAEHGTQIRSSQAALRVLAALHHCGLGPRRLYAPKKSAVSPVPVKTGHVSHAVTLTCGENGIEAATKPAGVQVELIPGVDESLFISGDLTNFSGGTVTFPELLPSDPFNGKPTYSDTGDAFADYFTKYASAGIGSYRWYLQAPDALWQGPINGNEATPNDVDWEPVSTATGSPVFSGGLQPATVSLTCETDGAAIRYTVAGDYPTSDNGTLYEWPFTLPAAGTIVRAVAYAAGMQPSDLTELLITE